MFGRKTRRRNAQLEQQVARLLAVLDERDNTNIRLGAKLMMLERRYGQLHERVDSMPVAAAEIAEPRPYVVWDARTEPRPPQGESELTDTEAHVVPCPSCGQPHGVGQACAGEIEEAA